MLAALHRRQLAGAIAASRANVVLSWMNRATSMVPKTKVPHVARLGGFYKLKHYRSCDWLVANTRGIADYLVAKACRRTGSITRSILCPMARMVRPLTGRGTADR